MHPLLRSLLWAFPVALIVSVLVWPLDVRLDMQRAASLAIDVQNSPPLVVTLAPSDAELLNGSRGVLDELGLSELPLDSGGRSGWSAQHRPWRRAHALLIQRLRDAGARGVAFDFYFGAEAPEHSEPLIESARAARAAEFPVVFGVWDKVPSHRLYAESGDQIGALRAVQEGWWGSVQVLSTRTRMPDRRASGELVTVPGLFLRAWKAANPRGEFETELPDSLWLVHTRDHLPTISYSQALLMPDELRNKAKDGMVFVGLTGRWAQGLDLHRVSYVPPGRYASQSESIPEGQLYGIFLQAMAFHQLQVRRFVTDVGPWLTLLLLLGAALLAAGPTLLLALLRDPSEQQLFQDALPPARRTAGMRIWPWPQLIGLLLLTAALALLWSRPLYAPFAAIWSLGLVVNLVLSIEPMRARFRARRFLNALARVDWCAREQKRYEAPLRLPPGGVERLFPLLATPSLHPAAAAALVHTLNGLLVDEEGRKLMQRLPRSFFQDRGWLEDEPGEQHSESWLKKLPKRADELTEDFCCTRVRRIRNLWSHARLSAHARKLGLDALEALSGCRERLDAAGCLRLQRALLDEGRAYLEAVAEFLEGAR